MILSVALSDASMSRDLIGRTCARSALNLFFWAPSSEHAEGPIRQEFSLSNQGEPLRYGCLSKWKMVIEQSVIYTTTRSAPVYGPQGISSLLRGIAMAAP